MYKIAIIDVILKDGGDLLKKHNDFQVDLINDVSEDNMIKKIEAFESTGAIYIYTVIKSKSNLRNLKFEFDTSKYENIYIIDLR